MNLRLVVGPIVALAQAAVVLPAAEPEHVRARLVTDASSLAPGGTFRVGVLFEVEPGWHLYWKNPGDAGLAIEVVLGLPEGFEVGPVRWPLPGRFIQPGDLAGYGYQGEVLLAADVASPELLPVGGPQVTASVSWLACKDRCVLGSARLAESWPLAVAKAAFERWRSTLPEPEGSATRPFTVTVVGGLAPGERSGTVSLWLQWSDLPASVEWFPETGEHWKVADAKVRTRGTLTRIDAEVSRVGPGETNAAELRSLVVAVAGDGERRGWELTLPVTGDSRGSPGVRR